MTLTGTPRDLNPENRLQNLRNHLQIGSALFLSQRSPIYPWPSSLFHFYSDTEQQFHKSHCRTWLSEQVSLLEDLLTLELLHISLIMGQKDRNFPVKI